ncbi:MAG: DUF1275 family protein [Acidobacteriota bacterium]
MLCVALGLLGRAHFRWMRDCLDVRERRLHMTASLHEADHGAARLPAALLLAAALASIGLAIGSATPPNHLYVVIVLTAVAMGLRNATVRRLAVPDLTTTVQTLTLTGLAADSFLAGGANPRIGLALPLVLNRRSQTFSLLAERALSRLDDHRAPGAGKAARRAYSLTLSAASLVEVEEDI